MNSLGATGETRVGGHTEATGARLNGAQDEEENVATGVGVVPEGAGGDPGDNGAFAYVALGQRGGALLGGDGDDGDDGDGGDGDGDEGSGTDDEEEQAVLGSC